MLSTCDTSVNWTRNASGVVCTHCSVSRIVLPLKVVIDLLILLCRYQTTGPGFQWHSAQWATMSSHARWWYQARCHLEHIFWYLTHRHAPPSNLYMSDLDSWLDSTPFWCKNHFCSFKTEGDIKYFLTKIFFLLHPLSKGVAPLCNGGHILLVGVIWSKV